VSQYEPIFFACVAAFSAGCLDAMAGGGGLIQLPALMALMPQEAPGTVLGTNKAAAIWGTSVALFRYSRSLVLPWRSVGIAAGVAFLGSGVGAALARQIDPAVFRPMVLVLLLAVAVFTLLRPDWGSFARGRERPMLAAGLGALIGFYDGLIGPGTGTFLIMAFIGALGLDFLGASAAAKAVNVATNLAALLIFGLGGYIRWSWALPMALANALGGLLGARLAIQRGSAFVRRIFQAAIFALIARLAWVALTTA
jgi:uncharacterized membrane protein YfcA